MPICWRSSPSRCATLHRRASAWYAQHGSAADAIRHALAAEDFDARGGPDRAGGAGDAPEQAGGHGARLAQGAPRRAGPPSGPCSASAYAGSVAGERRARGRRGPAAGRRTVAGHDGGQGERPEAPAAGMVVVDEEEFRRLPGAIAVSRAGQALTAGRCGRHRGPRPAGARPRPGGRPSPARIGGGAPGARLLGERGSRGGAPEYAEGMASLQRAGHIADALGCAIALADIRIAQGRLREAMRTYERALQLADGAGRAGAAGDGGHVRGHGRAPPRAWRSGCRRAAPAAERGAGRAHRVTAKPVSLARRDGAHTGGARRSGRRARPARRGGAPVCGRLLPQCAPRRGDEGAGVGRAGQGGRGPRTGRASGACPPRTTSATCASSSTSPWPGCSSPEYGRDRARPRHA